MATKKEEHYKRIAENKALKDAQKKVKAEEAKVKQDAARAIKEAAKIERKKAHDKRQKEAKAIKEAKLAERRERHAAKVKEQDLLVINRKQREVTIEFSDFQSIKAALAEELSKYGNVENITRTLSGCEARFSNIDEAQSAVAAGEVEATVNLQVSAAEIKQHSFHYFPAEGTEIDPAYLSSVSQFFTTKVSKGGSVSGVTKKRGAVVVGFNSVETKDKVLAKNSDKWSIAGNAIGTLSPGFPPKQTQHKKQKVHN